MEKNIFKTSKGKAAIVIAIIIAGILVAGAVVYKDSLKWPGKIKNIPAQEAADKAINYINNKLLGGQTTVSLVEVSEDKTYNLYKVKFNLANNELVAYTTRDGKLLFPEGYDLTEDIPKPVEEEGQTIGDFTVSKEEICKKDEKPIVYFFGSESCPHCTWEHPILQKVVDKFKENIDFRDNVDSENDMDIFSRYSTGSIPTLILGCKYYRVGSGEQAGEEEETKILTALICKLTDGKPTDVCSQVQDLIDQVK